MIANKDGGVSARVSGQNARRRASPSTTPSSGHLNTALDATSRWLLEQQHPEGYWVGELEGDTILESEYVLLMAFTRPRG